jgi:protease-4
MEGSIERSKRPGRWLITVLAGLGAISALIIVIGLVYVIFLSGPGSVPGRVILELDLERDYPEYLPEDLVARAALGEGPTVRDVVEALERGARDDRVEGLIARVGGSGMGLARIQEIRDAVQAFRAQGKPAIAYSETFGEFGPGNGAYYLATAFDEIYLQPSGDVGLTGLLVETPFPTEGLEKIGVTMRGDRRYEYKNAYNVLTDTAYTDAFREATSHVMQEQFSQMVEGIAKARGLDAEAVEALFDRGPFLGAEAVEARLVDGLAYRDEVYDKMMGRFEEDPELLYARAYLQRAGRPHDDGEVIALIYGVGGVQRGENRFDPLFQSATMGSETVTAAFRAAVDDDDVKAIVFRVDSPGGSYVASDAIWRAVVEARAEGVPVIVSMGDVAGSGGYFVAMAADRIVAQPATITGSIGVLSLKPLTSEMWEKLGIDWDEVQTSENAEMWSGLYDYDEPEWQRFQAWLDRVYEDFTRKVSDGRQLPLEKTLEIARGRIWPGSTAKELGLVDELGGFPAAGEGGGGHSRGSGDRAQALPAAAVALGARYRWRAVQQRGGGRGGGPETAHAHGPAAGASRETARARSVIRGAHDAGDPDRALTARPGGLGEAHDPGIESGCRGAGANPFTPPNTGRVPERSDGESEALAQEVDDLGYAASLSYPHHRHHDAFYRARPGYESGDDLDLSIQPLDSLSSTLRIERGQIARHAPGASPRPRDAEVDDRIVSAAAETIEELQGRPGPGQPALSIGDAASQDVVHPREVAFQLADLPAGCDAGGGDPEVQIDVRVHPEQQVLKHDRPPTLAGGERRLPRFAGSLTAPVLVEGLQVAIGKGHVQPFHPRTVVEEPILNARAHVEGDVTIQRREVAEPAPLPARPIDDLIEPLHDFVDCLGVHSAILADAIEATLRPSAPERASGFTLRRLLRLADGAGLHPRGGRGRRGQGGAQTGGGHLAARDDA